MKFIKSKQMRNFSFMDSVLGEIDLSIRTLISPQQRSSKRPVPGDDLPESPLDMAERKHIAGLLRVNHAGEVCAQALYQGQALTAQLTEVKEKMTQAAEEETDHLAWCEQRMAELGGQTSILNPVWYLASLLTGALAGLSGDHISLGFVAETEVQVAAHLQNHLKKLPAQEVKTRMILEQMHKDEAHHAEEARQAGGVELPVPVKLMMSGVSKLMTLSSYYL